MKAIGREHVCCFFWVMYSVRPDWLYMGSADFTPLFINKAIVDKFQKMSKRLGWGGTGLYGSWRRVVEDCGKMDDATRAALANDAAKLLMPEFSADCVNPINPPVDVNEDVMQRGRGELVEEQPPERSISFED